MRSRFWTFVEACDATRSPRAVRDLLSATFRELDVVGFAILTHASAEDLRSLSVRVHNWPQETVDHYLGVNPDGSPNPFLPAVETAEGPISWPGATGRRDAHYRRHKAWFDALRASTGQGEGVSQALRSLFVRASCSLTSQERLDPDRVRLCMRIGNYAYQQILALQRPELLEQDQLTAREHEFLYRATILGERPSDVAGQAGVKISTVRTLRQKASVRLNADTQEQAAWRLIETGQLFRAGRRSRPRRR